MITTITLTRAQYKELMNIPACSNAWFERLADITECDPRWLMERITLVTAICAHPSEVEEVPYYSCRADDSVWFIYPVSQKRSGVVEVIER